MYRVGWPTRDGCIPYKLFMLYVSVIDALESAEELRYARGHSLGEQLAQNGKHHTTKANVRRLTRRAYPEVEEEEPDGPSDGS